MPRKTHQAFSVIELIVTLVIATGFLTAAYTLYTTVIADSGSARLKSAAASVAYDYVRRYSNTISGTCGATYPQTTNLTGLTPTGLDTVNVTIVISCPIAASSNLFKVQASVNYNNYQDTVTEATYVSSQN